MEFQLSQHPKTSNMTSNITHFLTSQDIKEMRDIITPRIMEEVFGPGDETLWEPDRGYTDPEWYFTGPGGTVLGIGFRWGMTRLRGRNVQNQFVTPEEVCSSFLQQVLYTIELAQEGEGK